MATAKAIPVASVKIQLELTPEEAATLYIISRNVGGDPVKSRRGHTDSIGEAIYCVLEQQGIVNEVSKVRSDGFTGSFVFKNAL